MGEAYFYHLTKLSLETALPQLLAASLKRGWRVAVRGTSNDQLSRLDNALWDNDPTGFLPHGMAGGDHDALQPILLTTSTARPNNATCVISIDGAEITAEEIKSLDRACILFDGIDITALDHARTQWRTLTDAGVGAQYWSDETGGWTQKAAKPAAG